MSRSNHDKPFYAKVIAHYKCTIDNEDMSDRCGEGYCNYYKRKEENKKR